MNKDLKLIGEAYHKQILLKEEYSYMYDKIPFDFEFPIVYQNYDIEGQDGEIIEIDEKVIKKEWEDVKEKIYLFYEAEYKRAKLIDKRHLFDPFIDKLYTYFKNLYDSYMNIFEWEREKDPDVRRMIDQDWYHISRVDKPYEEDPRDPRSRKILAINSIINLIHRDTPMLTRYIRTKNKKDKKWEETNAGQLEAFLNTMSNDPGKFTRRWDKEIEKEFDVRIVNGRVLS